MPLTMTSPRLSALFLGLAALFGVCGIGLRSTLELSGAWGDTLSFLCVGALAAFVVTFLMTLDKSPLLRK